VKLILFTKNIIHPACRQLMNALDRMTVPFRVISARQELLDVMIKMRSDEALIIFLLMDIKEMEILNVMRPQILDRKIITILPDDSEHSCTIGRSVLPRFQALLSDDLSMVAEVAARIISTVSESGK
jgi:siroheme synthase (precorrin-2 oxidase/ferrochelatase)